VGSRPAWLLLCDGVIGLNSGLRDHPNVLSVERELVGVVDGDLNGAFSGRGVFLGWLWWRGCLPE
jgi:hypothetical protein